MMTLLYRITMMTLCWYSNYFYVLFLLTSFFFLMAKIFSWKNMKYLFSMQCSIDMNNWLMKKTGKHWELKDPRKG